MPGRAAGKQKLPQVPASLERTALNSAWNHQWQRLLSHFLVSLTDSRAAIISVEISWDILYLLGKELCNFSMLVISSHLQVAEGCVSPRAGVEYCVQHSMKKGCKIMNLGQWQYFPSDLAKKLSFKNWLELNQKYFFWFCSQKRQINNINHF